MELKIAIAIMSFLIGVHLLRVHGDIFKELLVGSRLFYYTEIPENLGEEIVNG